MSWPGPNENKSNSDDDRGGPRMTITNAETVLKEGSGFRFYWVECSPLNGDRNASAARRPCVKSVSALEVPSHQGSSDNPTIPNTEAFTPSGSSKPGGSVRNMYSLPHFPLAGSAIKQIVDIYTQAEGSREDVNVRLREVLQDVKDRQTVRRLEVKDDLQSFEVEEGEVTLTYQHDSRPGELKMTGPRSHGMTYYFLRREEEEGVKLLIEGKDIEEDPNIQPTSMNVSTFRAYRYRDSTVSSASRKITYE